MVVVIIVMLVMGLVVYWRVLPFLFLLSYNSGDAALLKEKVKHTQKKSPEVTAREVVKDRKTL